MLTEELLEQRSIQPGVLYEKLADQAREIYNRGKTLPVIIFDLDYTLFDLRPRVMKILADMLMDPAVELDDETKAAIAQIKPRLMQYSLEDTLKASGVTDSTVIHKIVSEFNKRVWTDQYVMFDLPTPGVVDFIKGLSTAGAMTVYLGGDRHKDESRFGTERSISMYELPAPRGEVGALFMRDKKKQTDLEFKKELVEPLAGIGEVLAVFDNSPEACNLFAESYKDSEIVLLDTFRGSDDYELHENVKVMKNFVR